MNRITIEHKDAMILIEELPSDLRRITVTMKTSGGFCPMKCWATHYTLELIRAILEAQGPSFLCDEIQRDENPGSVQADLVESIFTYVERSAFEGKTILDFGCGCGSSTAIIARMLPKTHIIGVDIEPKFLAVARMRGKFYGIPDLSLICSSVPDHLPVQIGDVDFVLLSAVFEHLLPNERQSLLLQMWERLVPGGIMFINQTPDRRFPVETHTTGLPLVNYCPDKLALFLAHRFSRRVDRTISWNSLLRKGIRGTTPHEVLNTLSHSSTQAKLLQPMGDGIRRQSDIWYHASRSRFSGKDKGIKGLVVRALIKAVLFTGIPVAPYLSLAFKKMK